MHKAKHERKDTSTMTTKTITKTDQQGANLLHSFDLHTRQTGNANKATTTKTTKSFASNSNLVVNADYKQALNNIDFGFRFSGLPNRFLYNPSTTPLENSLKAVSRYFYLHNRTSASSSMATVNSAANLSFVCWQYSLNTKINSALNPPTF